MKKIICGIALLFSTSMVAGAHTCCHNSAQKCGCKRGYPDHPVIVIKVDYKD